ERPMHPVLHSQHMGLLLVCKTPWIEAVLRRIAVVCVGTDGQADVGKLPVCLVADGLLAARAIPNGSRQRCLSSARCQRNSGPDQGQFHLLPPSNHAATCSGEGATTASGRRQQRDYYHRSGQAWGYGFHKGLSCQSPAPELTCFLCQVSGAGNLA